MANEIMSLEGQLCGIPLAGPESFSQQQLDYLKRALGVDETVLWDNYTFASNKSSQVVMSENPFNFSCVRITFEIETTTESWPTVQTQIIDLEALNNCANKEFTLNGTCVSDASLISRCSRCKFNGTSIQDLSSVQWYIHGTEAMVNPLHIYRIVGIHRIAGGN